MGGRIQKFFLLIALGILGTVSCSRMNETEARLTEAESLIMERPDSALTILEDIDTLSLRNAGSKALYGLLYTMALDKNHLDPTDDGLIKGAVDYYNDKGDIEKQIWAEYYRGRVLYLREDYTKALVSFFKAKEKAEQTQGQIFWAGMACRGISDIYMKLSRPSDELKYAQKEHEYIQKSSIQPYVDYSLMDLARAYNNNLRRKEVIDLSTQMIDSALQHRDEYLYYQALSFLALNTFRLYESDKSIPIFHELLLSGYADPMDSLYYIWNLVEIGKVDEGENLLKEVSDVKLPLKSYIKYKIYRIKGKDRDAISAFEEVDFILGDSSQKENSYDIFTTITDYFELEKKLDRERIDNQRLKIVLIVSVSLSILSFTFILIIHKIKQHHKEIKEREYFLDELKRNLSESEDTNNKISSSLKDMLRSNFKIISEIGELLKYNPNDKKSRKRFEDKIEETLKGISVGGSLLPQIEDRINEIYDNLIKDLKEDLPGMKDEDYALYIYSILDFSNASMAVLLGEERIDSVYNRKRRLKDRIKKLEGEKADRYLSVFS